MIGRASHGFHLPLSLAMLALASAALWRLEVEWHGFDGFMWLTYFHWAVPVGVALFLGWVWYLSPFPSRRARRGFFLAAAVLSPVLIYLTEQALRLIFAAGPSAGLVAMSMGFEAFLGLQVISRAYILSIPLWIGLVARCSGVPVTWTRLLLSCLIFYASCPVALLMLRALAGPAGHDAVYAIKSGFVIPLLVVGLGILFLPPSHHQPGWSPGTRGAPPTDHK